MQKTISLQKEKTYTVKKGDYLWQIAVVTYGSGYKAYDIAKANNIAHPSLIEPGQVLKLPDVKVAETGQIGQAVSTAKVTYTKATYTVQKGDFLWNIAEKAYGDGLMWTKIAKANNITTPDTIYSGTVLRIPRN